MNWLIRFGQWWEDRRVLRKPDLKAVVDHVNDIVKTVDSLQEKQQIPPALSKEIALLSARLSHLELFVGMKREPQPQHVPGGAKIS